MDKARLHVLIDTDIKKKLEEWASENKKTLGEAVEVAAKLLLNIKPRGEEVEAVKIDDINEIQLRQIVFKYPQRCSSHVNLFGKPYTIQVGEIGYWAKGVAVCYRCYLKLNEHQLEDSKRLARLYKEIQKLSILKRELKKEVDKYAREVSVWELLIKIENYYRRVEQRLSSLSIYNPRSEDVQKLREELREVSKKIVRELNLTKPMLKQYAKDLTKQRW